MRSQVQTVDSSMSLEKLAKRLKAMDICKLRGSPESSILVIYMVEAAGEHDKDARRSPTPMRRDHLEKILRAVFTTRASGLPDFEMEKVIYPQMDASDVQHGRFKVFCSSVSILTCFIMAGTLAL